MENIRQADVVEPRLFQIDIAGCGGGGSLLAFALVRMGFKVRVWDFDFVAEENIGTQLFRLQDIGKPKVEAIKEILAEFTVNPIEIENRKMKSVETDVLVLAVDDMDMRKKIFEKSKFDLVIDLRMNPYTFTVISMMGFQRDSYFPLWFPQSEAEELPCMARATSYTAMGEIATACAIIKRYNDEEAIPLEQHFCYRNLVHSA